MRPTKRVNSVAQTWRRTADGKPVLACSEWHHIGAASSYYKLLALAPTARVARATSGALHSTRHVTAASARGGRLQQRRGAQSAPDDRAAAGRARLRHHQHRQGPAEAGDHRPASALDGAEGDPDPDH
eukprot:scaffold3456_cov58-Phaeocystis_antarctica.AAC.3